jgi:hypothetical protein
VLEAVKAKPAVAAEGRPALTAPARAGLSIVWVGTKKRAFKSNKETGMKKKACREFTA